MRSFFTYSFTFFILIFFTSGKCSSPELKEFTHKKYAELNQPEISYDAFHNATIGYYYLLKKGTLKNTRYLSIIDMSKSANKERYYLIDMKENKLVYQSLIAHGKNTGEEYAKHFSNIENSYQTSIGFYTTAETYTGKNGLSMRMDGLEYCNDKARKRDIVVHNADYVSPQYIKENGRLGRSFGCPALPIKGYEKIIEKIKNGSCFYIYYPDRKYFQKSSIIKLGEKAQLTENGQLL